MLNSILWIATGILAAAMLITGLAKAAKSKKQLHGSDIAYYTSGMTYVGNFPAWLIRSLGVAEVLSAVVLILPRVFGIAPGAIVVHVRRREISNLMMPGGLLVLAVFIAVGRFGPWPL